MNKKDEMIDMLQERIKDVEKMDREFARRELAAIMKTMGINELEFDWNICMESGEDEIEFIPMIKERKTIYRLIRKEIKKAS